MVRIEYGVCVEDWIDIVSREKERIQEENLIKDISCIAYWKCRNVSIATLSSITQESDDYIYEFIVYGRIRAFIYVRRNDSNTVDIITTLL